MAMTVRFPPELDAQLQRLAEEKRASKHSLVVQAVEEHLARERKTRAVIESLEETSRDYAGLIARLEDA